MANYERFMKNIETVPTLRDSFLSIIEMLKPDIHQILV